MVDDDEFERLNQFKWFCLNKGYAARHLRRLGKQKTIIMHREILDTPDGMEIDHINGVFFVNHLGKTRLELLQNQLKEISQNRKSTSTKTKRKN